VNEIAPEAYCDALFVAGDAPKSLLPMSIVEMHLFSYLGCILALFRGKAIGDWGYSYAVTTEGFPFSAEFEDGRTTLVLSGLLDSDDNGLLHPRRAELMAELETVVSLGPWADRRPLLRAAMECALALPLGSIRYAIGQTPGIASAVRLRQRRRLLDPDDVSLLYDEYKVVSLVLGPDVQDVLSPAVIWLSARILRNEDAEVAAL
jgi:hypothetical protein